ncbi:uncharacterized protein LOC113512680 [Galleria mellonella]|uniref:Uncharacterized protein LOC113512680 n=1 Tax=Galleria mellonella TaxID=7137 RepID=A0ABM3MHH6_GALME|nr:uncharacterized protein LOC113512680 [Galleria mellonella]
MEFYYNILLYSIFFQSVHTHCTDYYMLFEMDPHTLKPIFNSLDNWDEIVCRPNSIDLKTIDRNCIVTMNCLNITICENNSGTMLITDPFEYLTPNNTSPSNLTEIYKSKIINFDYATTESVEDTNNIESTSEIYSETESSDVILGKTSILTSTDYYNNSIEITTENNLWTNIDSTKENTQDNVKEVTTTESITDIINDIINNASITRNILGDEEKLSAEKKARQLVILLAILGVGAVSTALIYLAARKIKTILQSGTYRLPNP